MLAKHSIVFFLLGTVWAPLSATEAVAVSATALPTLAAPMSSPSAPTVNSPSAATVAQPLPVSPVSQVLTPVPTQLSPTAGPLAVPQSGTVEAEGDSLVAEEVGDNGQVEPKTTVPDLAKLDSDTLASIASGVDRDAIELFYDPLSKLNLPGAAPGAWRVPVDLLYAELAKRTLNDAKDQSARQSFALALLKDPDRAKEAKDSAYDDKLADTVIAQLEAGRPRAKGELQGLAEKGNRKARLYLGLDKVLASPAPAESSPSAQSLSPGASSGQK